MKLNRYEVIGTVPGRSGNVLGYVYARDADHAYSLAAQWYRVPFVLIGAGVVPHGEAA